MDINYTYDMQRSQLGRQPMFCETRSVLCDSIEPNVENQQKFMLRNPVHQPVQNTPPLSMGITNTYRAIYTSTGVLHDEGGWPRDVNPKDEEATQRYRRRIEKEDGYIHCVGALTPDMEHYVFQNNAINMYQAYYSELTPFPQVEERYCRNVNIYRDEPPDGHKRPVSSICWQPDGGNHFVASYVDIDFDQNPRGSVSCYSWDVENATKPEITLLPPQSLIDLQYNPRSINVLAGGLVNGQVCSFDLRTTPKPVLMCPLHVSHRELVRSVVFINAKSGMEFFSGSADGSIKWWDLRKIDEPTEEFILDMVTSATDEPSLARANGVSYLEFEPTIPTRFMVGTENGMVIMGNRKAKSVQDRLPGKYDAHLGPVWRVERNPGFMKNFLTVGDWTARIWSEECRESSIMWTPSYRHRITDGAWSPTRFSLMLLAHSNGVVSVWDLLRQQRESVLNVKICDTPLTKIRMHEDGKMFICGNNNGDIFLLKLSKNLQESDPYDKALMTNVFERETKGERILEARMREIRLKHRQAEEGSPVASIADSDHAVGDKDLAEATAEYMAIIRKEHQH